MHVGYTSPVTNLCIAKKYENTKPVLCNNKNKANEQIEEDRFRFISQMLKLQLISICKTHNIQFSFCCCCFSFYHITHTKLCSFKICNDIVRYCGPFALLVFFIWFFVHTFHIHIFPIAAAAAAVVASSILHFLFYFNMNAPIDLIYFILACKTNSEIDALNLFDITFFFSLIVLFYDSFCHFYVVRVSIFFFFSFLFLYFMNFVARARVKTMHCT